MINFNRFEILDTDLARRYTDSLYSTNHNTKPSNDGKNVSKSRNESKEAFSDSRNSSYTEDRKSAVVKKYLKQVKESKGFVIKDYPGFIPDVTNIVPCQEVIHDREHYPEEYDKIMDMAALAIKVYNEKHQYINFKVADIKKLNVESCLAETTYYITFSAVNVKQEEEESPNKSGFLDKLVTNSEIVMTTFLYWLCLQCLLPWKQSLGTKLKKLKIPINLKASKQEVSDKTAIRKIFQAKVRDDIGMKRKVLFCKAK